MIFPHVSIIKQMNALEAENVFSVTNFMSFAVTKSQHDKECQRAIKCFIIHALQLSTAHQCATTILLMMEC